MPRTLPPMIVLCLNCQKHFLSCGGKPLCSLDCQREYADKKHRLRRIREQERAEAKALRPLRAPRVKSVRVKRPPPVYPIEDKLAFIRQSRRACIRCGYKEFTACIDLHHVDGKSKKFTLSGFTAKRLHETSWEDLRAEIAKCVPLCACCHRAVTAGLAKLPESSHVELLPLPAITV